MLLLLYHLTVYWHRLTQRGFEEFADSLMPDSHELDSEISYIVASKAVLLHLGDRNKSSTIIQNNPTISSKKKLNICN